MTTILVTGATGAVGRHVTRELAARGVAVRALVRDGARATALLGSEPAIAIGDLADVTAVRAAMEGVDAVFLSCGNHPDQVGYETNVIDAAVDSGVDRIVKLSALGARLGSPLAFWENNARIEQHLGESDVSATTLQPGFLMSNLLAFAPMIQGAGQFFLPAGAASVALTDPRDVALAAAVTLTEAHRPGGLVRLTGPAALTFDEVAEVLSVAVGSTVKYVDVPDEAARAAMIEAGMPQWFADNLVLLYGLIRTDGLAEVTREFRVLTGTEPRNLATFVRDHAGHFCA